jgi:hypothetical protein
VRNESHSESKQSGFSVGVSYAGYGANVGQTKNEATQTSTLDVINDGTVLKADQNLNVKADNISVVSGELTSGQNTTLDANKDLTLASAQDIHQTSTSKTAGTTRTAGVSYGTSYGGDTGANVKVGLNVSKGTEKTKTTTVTDTVQKGTQLTSGKNITITSGNDTTLVNTDVKASGQTNINAGGDVNLLAAADTHEVTNTTSTTKTSSIGGTAGVSANVANDGLSTDGSFTTGTLNTGLTQTKSKTTTTSTTTTTTTEKGTTIRSDGGTVVVAANNVDMESTATTGDVLTAGDTVTAGGAVNETTLEDTSKTVTTTTSTSSASTKFSGPDIKQAALDTVANAVGEVGANKIGDLKADGLDTVTHKVLHAANGAVQGAIKSGGDLDGAAAGAIGAAVGEIVAEVVDDGTATRTNEKGQQVTKLSALAAQLVAGLTGTDTNIAANAATNAVQNNRLLHVDEVKRIEALADGDKKKEKRLLAALCARTNCTIFEKDLSDGVTQEKALEAYHSIRANYASLEEMNAALSLEHKTLGAEYTKTGFFAYNSYSQTRDGYIEQGDSERLKALDRRFRPYGDQYEKNSRDAAAVVRHKETVELNLKDLNAGKIGFSEYLENVGMMRVGYDQLSLPAELDAEYLKLVEKDPKAAQLIADGIMTSDKVFTALELATLTKGIASLLKGGPKALEKVNFKPKGNQNYDSLKGGTSKTDKREILRQNRERGKALENETVEELRKDSTNIQQEVTVKTESGTKTRLDIVREKSDGTIECVECKSSETAPLTKNQKKAFPEIEQTGATVVGKGKPGFEGGSSIPPTKVKIVRPHKE